MQLHSTAYREKNKWSEGTPKNMTSGSLGSIKYLTRGVILTSTGPSALQTANKKFIANSVQERTLNIIAGLTAAKILIRCPTTFFRPNLWMYVFVIKASRRVLINFSSGGQILSAKFREMRSLCRDYKWPLVGDNNGARVQFDPFSWAKFLRGFRERAKNRNFHLLLIAYRSRAFTNPRQNHRDFACPACVTESCVRRYRR